MSQHTQDREGKSRKVSETAGFIGQHTPGPFKIEQNDTEGMYLVNEAGTILCEWVHLPDDARLIAAAPEMLAFIKKYLISLELAGMKNDATSEARALLARMEGDA